MTRNTHKKLNQMMIAIPPGVVITHDWLNQQGISAKLAWWYVHSGWLERLGEKAYKKAGDKIGWTGAIAALQHQLHLPIHIGSKTALQLLGRAHFIPQEMKQIILFAPSLTKIPAWLNKPQLFDSEFIFIKTSLFQEKDLGIIERSLEGMNLKLSSPERAAMELLYMVPKYQSFHEAALLLENLGQARPAIIQSLLEQCLSIKVKRLFLYLSESFQHPWFNDLDLKKIDLGKGKRVIDKGGKYDAKYLLSIPDIKEE